MFHNLGAEKEKARSPYVTEFTIGTVKNVIHCFVFYCFLEKLLLNYHKKKMRRCPQFCFLIPVAHTKICFPRIVIICAIILLYEEAPSLKLNAFSLDLKMSMFSLALMCVRKEVL